MTLSFVDRDGSSAIAAAEGQAALAAGDTPHAQGKFAEAGAALERTIRSLRRPTDKHLARFLAASQYYNGGLYPKALGLCQKIEGKLLPPEVRGLFPRFFRDVRDRTKGGYQAGVRRQLISYWQKKDFDGILGTLQEHPYVLAPGAMAFIRAVINEELKNYRAAALFIADAVRLAPNGAGFVYCATVLPLTLPGEGRLEEAWQYVAHLLELLPHPVIYAVASLLCFQRASAKEERGRSVLFEEQLRYFDQARDAYQRLPAGQQAKPELRDLIVLGFEAAAHALIRLGDRRRARLVCDEAVSFAPESPRPWVMRGIARKPEAKALDDFKKAVSLGDQTYFPYAFLAQDALAHENYRLALTLLQLALQKRRRPPARITSQLMAAMAICQDRLGADRKEVEALFRQAIEIEPKDEKIKEQYQLFLSPTSSSQAQTSFSWLQDDSGTLEANCIQDLASRVSEKPSSNDIVMRELQAVAA